GLLAGVDELAQGGYVDEHRLGVTGGSGGGVLTNWLIGHTSRFAAAVSQRSIADWSAWWYTADFTLFQPTWFHGAPWEQADDFRARSPLSYVTEIKTPLMLIEGESDYRTPPATGGEELFRALKYLHRPVVMVRFPGESHELSRSGGPWHRVERLQHILNWFDIHLLGKELHIYDVGGAEVPTKTEDTRRIDAPSGHSTSRSSSPPPCSRWRRKPPGATTRIRPGSCRNTNRRRAATRGTASSRTTSGRRSPPAAWRARSNPGRT